MVTTGTLLSAEEFDRLLVEEGRRYELLEGELVELSSPTPQHNRIQAFLIAMLYPSVAGRRGDIWPTTEFSFGAHRCQPDVAVFIDGRWKQWDMTKVPADIIPDIAVKIISPSESAVHVEKKIDAYLRHGVKEVWILHSMETPHLYVHQRGSVRRLDIGDSLSTPILPGWSIRVREIFEICE
jgi:Uma2 family endonuclease